MYCLVEHISTYDPNNYIYCRSGEYSIGKVFPSILQASFIPENNDVDDDEYEQINV